jgi:hypothetical protein
MFVSTSNLHKIGSHLRIGSLAAALASAAALATTLPALAQNTRLWSQSKIEEFEKGTPEGVSLTSDGHLRQGPSLTDILTSPSTFVWSVAADAKGTAWLGTASPATVLRVGKDGKTFTLFETRDLSVQVVRLGPDGSLYAATLPSGKVYRLKSDSATKQDDVSATVIFDPSKLDDGKSAGSKSDDKSGDGKPEPTSHYIWDMTFDASGRLYIATGGPAAVYRVDPANPASKPEAFFKSDEEHIRSLAWDAKGNLIAGSDGSGLVYRIDPQGKGYVLFEAPRREITAVAVSASGTIYAASVGDKSRNPLPPLPLSGVGTVTITVVQPGSMQAANTSTALPEGTEIYALTEGRAPRKLWSGKDEIVYALTARPDGLLALTGNRGRIFRIAEDGSYADVARLAAQQGLSMTAAPGKEAAGRIFIGTGNTGKLIALGAAEKHEYASDVLDAGALSRFGRVEVDPGSTGYEFFTRSGNVEQPVRGWSEWSPLKDSTVASPAGRFLQWKAVLAANAVVGSVGVNYLPVNSVPVVDELVVVPGARATAPNQPAGMAQPITIALPSANAAGQGVTINFDGGPSVPLQAIKDRTAITVRWAAHDDDSDDLIYSLYLRGDGESVWRLLKDTITDKFYTFDATLIPDGGYQVKVVASDAPSHTPGDSLTAEKVSERFEVDTTPPVVTALSATVETLCTKGKPCGPAVHALFDAEDAFSTIAHAEYSLDAGPWQFIDPVGGLSDSRHEHYDFVVPTPPDAKISEHLITVRVYDRHDNVGVAKTVVHAAAAAPSR